VQFYSDNYYLEIKVCNSSASEESGCGFEDRDSIPKKFDEFLSHRHIVRIGYVYDPRTN
jgi:hypothetical protein